MKLSFLGAAQEVTGSCVLVETRSARFLVDCGLFQGGEEAARRNRHALDFDVSSLDFVLLTHAHLDHSGLLPRLVLFGFEGAIFCTAATADLLVVMLADAADIQESQARLRDRAGKRHEPLYDHVQAGLVTEQLRKTQYNTEIAPHDSVRCVFRDAGHILGSSILEVWINEHGVSRKLVFSGDIGQPGHPIVEDPVYVESADVLVIESTYGDRVHKSVADSVAEFTWAITDTIRRKQGNVVVPAFAVGRTQDLLYLLVRLFREQQLPELIVYVDSPMATAATEITIKHLNLADRDTVEVMQWLISNRDQPRIRFVGGELESRTLSEVRHGALIISSSGMCEGGRIQRHLRASLPRPECSVIFTGFQAAGTLGRRLIEGSKSVHVCGEEVAVRAALYTIGGLSAHADRDALADWLAHFSRAPEKTFVVHGEASVAKGFAELIRQRFKWDVTVPATHESFEL
ncbi:MAG: MBL fold metallo-hydrolase [Betaproteobacteria bacterium]|nr:MAG: MBL fold metallo-hydrolase [Betaproteobacteria bacterium]